VKKLRALSVGKMEALAARSQALIAAGFSVFSTNDAAQAMAVCRKSDFDVAIVGHLLAASDKQKLVRYFRERCGIPVLLVTGGPFLTTMRADAYVPVNRPISELVQAAQEIAARATEREAAN
jgi:DNA-binding NtrC family response regulator